MLYWCIPKKKRRKYTNWRGERISSGIIVHTFVIGDVEDPDIYAANPLWEWQESEMGKWVMAHAIETPEWHRMTDSLSYGYRYNVIAKLTEQDQTFWTLKWKDIK